MSVDKRTESGKIAADTVEKDSQSEKRQLNKFDNYSDGYKLVSKIDCNRKMEGVKISNFSNRTR